MIDFINAYTETKEPLEYRIKNDFFDSETRCSYDYINGISKYPCKRSFENIEVRITNTKAIVKNSIHTYFNLKNHIANGNYTDFYYSDLLYSFEQLQQELNEDISDYKVTNLEFGMNIQTSLNPKLMLENNFVMYNFDEYSQIDTFKGKGYYKQYNRSQYYVKLYDKGLQFKLPYNLLRVEIKIKDSKLLKKFGIYNVEDIYRTDCLNNLFPFFLDCFDKINIVDSFSAQEIGGEEKKLIELGKSPHYWRGIKQKYSSSSSYYDKIEEYNKLIEMYKLDTIKKELRGLLIDKFQLLIEVRD